MSTTSLSSLISALFDTEQKRRAVWQKARVLLFTDAAVERMDDYGSLIRYADYGDRTSIYGWEFGHVVANAFGGSDDISNLRPVQWRNNASEGPAIAIIRNALLGGGRGFGK